MLTPAFDLRTHFDPRPSIRGEAIPAGGTLEGDAIDCKDSPGPVHAIVHAGGEDIAEARLETSPEIDGPWETCPNARPKGVTTVPGETAAIITGDAKHRYVRAVVVGEAGETVTATLMVQGRFSPAGV